MAAHYVRLRVLRSIDSALAFVFRPLATAETLEVFARWGYVWLGILLAGASALILSLDVLQQPLRNYKTLQAVVEVLSSRLNVSLPASAPIALALALLYAGAALLPVVRTPIGEAIGIASLRVFGTLISFGEWCIEHRWFSLGLIMALIGAISVGLGVEHARMRVDNLAADRFAVWIRQTGSFVQRSTLTRDEWAQYAALPAWEHEFEFKWTHSPHHHPAVYLHRMMEQVFKSSAESPERELRVVLPTLVDLAKAAAAAAADKPNADAERTNAIAQLLLARVRLRLAEACTGECTELTAVKDMLDSLHSVSYQRARWNGLGIVYARGLSLALQNGTAPAWLCASAYSCAVSAQRYYDSAAVNAAACSFEDRRRTNNQIDLLVRIGLDFDRIVGDVPLYGRPRWLTHRDSLAADLQRRVAMLMRCNASGEVVTPSFVTAAEAFGTRAILHAGLPDSAARDVASAAGYVRMAYAFGETDVQSWRRRALCAAVSRSHIAIFKQALTSPAALVDLEPDQVIEAIHGGCESDTGQAAARNTKGNVSHGDAAPRPSRARTRTPKHPPRRAH